MWGDGKTKLYVWNWVSLLDQFGEQIGVKDCNCKELSYFILGHCTFLFSFVIVIVWVILRINHKSLRNTAHYNKVFAILARCRTIPCKLFMYAYSKYLWLSCICLQYKSAVYSGEKVLTVCIAVCKYWLLGPSCDRWQQVQYLELGSNCYLTGV